MQSDNPFNNLFREFPGLGVEEFGPDKPREKKPDPPGPAAEKPAPATKKAPPVPLEATALVEQMNRVRAEFQAMHDDIVKEVRALRRENARLGEENARWKALAKEYKQILSRG